MHDGAGGSGWDHAETTEKGRSRCELLTAERKDAGRKDEGTGNSGESMLVRIILGNNFRMQICCPLFCTRRRALMR